MYMHAIDELRTMSYMYVRMYVHTNTCLLKEFQMNCYIPAPTLSVAPAALSSWRIIRVLVEVSVTILHCLPELLQLHNNHTSQPIHQQVEMHARC